MLRHPTRRGTTVFFPRLVVLFMIVFGTASCSKFLAAVEEEAEQELVDGGGPAAVGEEPEGPTGPTEPTIQINSVQPARGLTSGNEQVEVIGIGFEPGIRVQFGPDPASLCNIIDVSATSILCQTPANPVPEIVAVRTILDNGDFAVEANAFEFFDPVEIHALTPNFGPDDGGNTVSILGRGFVTGTQVRFGVGGETLDAQFIDTQTLRVRPPFLAAGTYSVSVENLNGSANLEGAYTTFEPVRVTEIVPFAGPLAGGTAVTVSGRGFVDPTSVLFGSQTLTVDSHLSSTTLEGTVPPALPATEGAVHITAENTFGSHTKASGFVYYDPDNTLPRVISVAPSTGVVEGGGSLHVVVGGMSAGTTDVTVYFDDQVLSGCEVLDEHQVACPIPATDTEGTVDVRVVGGGIDVTVPDAYRYVDLEVHSLSPTSGAMAGGTFVRVVGNGFAPDTQVMIGGRRARDVEVVSAVEIKLWTPPGSPGSANLHLESYGIELEIADAFTYFNPAHDTLDASGGPIAGSINVTVTDGSAPIPGAFVVVGDSVDAAYQHRYGFTDLRGQITLSDEELIGPQNVHAGISGHSAMSWVQTNAQNISMMLVPNPPPQADPLPECPQGSGAPPIIRGNVYRSKDVFNSGDDLVIVTTTTDRSRTPLPDPGPGSQLVSHGFYELVSRTGELMVMAIAGTVQDDGINPPEFIPHAMGFRPSLTTEPSSAEVCEQDSDCPGGETCIPAPDGSQAVCLRIYEGVDITIDRPIDVEMAITLDDPPYPSFGTLGPSVALAQVSYDFGHLGLHDMGADFDFFVDDLSITMPRSLPDSIVDFSSFDVTGGVFSVANGSLTAPLSQVTLGGLTNPRDEVVMTPMLKTHINTSPGIFDGGIHVAVALSPTTLPEVPVTANIHYVYDSEVIIPCEGAPPAPQTIIRWIAVARGDSNALSLPPFPPAAAGGNVPSGAHGWQLMSTYTPGIDFDNTDLNTLFGGRSIAIYADQVRN